jgi:hypothetical protein
MYNSTKIFNKVNVGEEAADNDNVLYIVDFTKDIQLREFRLQGKMKETSGTGPGASKDIVVNVYWANERIESEAGVAVQSTGQEIAGGSVVDTIAAALENNKDATTKTLDNTASVVRNADFSASGNVMRPKARYAYITFDKPQLAAGSDVEFTLELVRIPTTQAHGVLN